MVNVLISDLNAANNQDAGTDPCRVHGMHKCKVSRGDRTRTTKQTN